MNPSRKIRVGLMAYAFDNRVAKGTAVYARNLTEHLLGDGRFEFTLIHYERTDDPVYGRARELLMPELPIRSRWLRQLAMYWKLRREPFDIIHWFQPRLYPGYWWAPSRYRVCTIHGGGRYYYPALSISARMFHLVLRFANRRLDCAIVGTRFSAAEAAATYHLDPASIRATYYGGGERFKPLDPAESLRAVRASFPQIRDGYILNVSRLQPHKNVAALVRAYIAMRDRGGRHEQLVVVAKPTEQYGEVYSLASGSAYARDIIFIDFIEADLLNPMYSAASLFVFPSLSEGFGLPIVEAMAAGVPVLTSDASCLPEVGGGAVELVNPRDEAAISRAMEELLADPARRSAMVAAGLERAKLFTWQGAASATADVYIELASAGKLC